MESVYLETTFISYLVARPSRDLIVVGHQQTTQEWWVNRSSEFECSVSQVVIDEASVGDSAEVDKRLAIISGLAALAITDDANALRQAIMAAGILPPQAVRDAAHVAVAAVHAIDYLLTWNCKHLANAQIAPKIAVVCSWENRVMWEDPIVAEVHRAREMLAAKFNYDVAAMFADMQKRQTALGDRLVLPRTRGEPTAEADRGRRSDSDEPTSSDSTPAA